MGNSISTDFPFLRDLQDWQNVGLSSWTVLLPFGERLPKGDASTEKDRAKRRVGDMHDDSV